MKRAHALASLRAAGYHDDQAKWARVYVESRVAYKVAQTAWQEGQKLKASGVKCSCLECKSKV